MRPQPSTDAIWTHLSADLRRFIRRRVSSDHAADDLLQETFLRVHRHVATLEVADRLAAWVYQIARNVIHDHFRRSKQATAAMVDVDPVDEGDNDPASTTPRGNARWLGALVDALPEGYQSAVRLAEIDGLSQQEVAARLGLSLSGAKSRIQRGCAMLKESLERCCHLEFDTRGRLLDCDPQPNQKVCKDCG